MSAEYWRDRADDLWADALDSLPKHVPNDMALAARWAATRGRNYVRVDRTWYLNGTRINNAVFASEIMEFLCDVVMELAPLLGHPNPIRYRAHGHAVLTKLLSSSKANAVEKSAAIAAHRESL
jgi:hypothetical protein